MRVFNKQDREEIILVLKPEEVVSLMDVLDGATREGRNNAWSMMLETLANETDC